MAVLITRPDERGTQLVEQLNQAGIAALHAPLFRLESGRELIQLPAELGKLKPQDIVFLVSKSAVDFCGKMLVETGFHWPEQVCYFTVGHRSAAYFTAQSGLPAHYPVDCENSEGVLALPPMQHLAGKRILILRGNGGRAFFAEQAALRQAEVSLLECYQRTPVAYHRAEQSSMWARAGIDTLVVTSLEALETLADFPPPEMQDWLKNCRLVTVSQRIAQAAQTLGWQHLTLSPKADNASLLQTLIDINSH